MVDHSRRQGSHPLGSAPESAKNLPIDLRFARFDSKETVSFKDFAGKVVLVNFWASWCEACMAEMPSIQKLYDQLKGEGFQVIAINVDDKPEKVVPQIVKGLHLTFPIYTEGDGELSKAFDVVAIPFSVVADRQQKIIMQEAGERDWSSEATVAEIRKLLKPI
ncbi:MAG: TlpA family protein disulfide reductase [Deltaproteobacteria bacterium]|nr:TlpA family protein disulfide reductase [Deltaproteobacteria bacterium]